MRDIDDMDNVEMKYRDRWNRDRESGGETEREGGHPAGSVSPENPDYTDLGC